MEVSDERYNALVKAYAESAGIVRWAYIHWDLDAGIESALKDAMGDGVAKAVVDLLNAVEALVADKTGLPRPTLVLRAEDFDPDEIYP